MDWSGIIVRAFGRPGRQCPRTEVANTRRSRFVVREGMGAVRFCRNRVAPWFFEMPKQQVYNQIDRSWRRITDRLIAAELAMRVLGRMANAAAYPCRAALVDRLPGEDSDIERLYLCLGSDPEDAAGFLTPATITSVVRDHAKSIVRCARELARRDPPMISMSRSATKSRISFPGSGHLASQFYTSPSPYALTSRRFIPAKRNGESS